MKKDIKCHIGKFKKVIDIKIRATESESKAKFSCANLVHIKKAGHFMVPPVQAVWITLNLKLCIRHFNHGKTLSF